VLDKFEQRTGNGPSSGVCIKLDEQVALQASLNCGVDRRAEIPVSAETDL
jgi:hypothetical protein